MRVLGIVHEHTATVCLMEDGRVVFCQSEERLNRLKNSSGFPVETLRHVYDHVAPAESIDLAVVFEKTIQGFLSMKARGFRPIEGGDYVNRRSRTRTLKQRLLQTNPAWRARTLKRSLTEKRASIRQEAESYFSHALRLDPDRIRYLDHHLAHAYSVLPNVWMWNRALVFTLDGYGDGLCATVNLYDHGRLRRLSACDERHSVGNYYRHTAWILGMKALEDEFKIAGLAPYAAPYACRGLLDELHGLLTVDDRGEWKSVPNPEALFDTLTRVYRFRRFDHIAGAIQSLTEALIVKWVSYWVAATGCRDVAVAGGVFMNVKASQRLAETESIDRLFVMPSAGDESCAIGSAAWGTLTHAPDMELQPLQDLYLGMTFSGADVERALADTDAARRYHISRPANMSRHVARLLADNKIVARCSGRMEFGARALGNRSILANPSDPLNVGRMNEAIKSRDFWMPFAPSILEEDMPRYVLGHDRVFAPYMCMTFDATPEAQHDLAAAIHPKDVTLRPQAVRREWNEPFFDIIHAFKGLTGIGAVLNTSFNLHGEPIVCSPADAIRTADRCRLEYLVLEDYLLVKQRYPDAVAREDHSHTRVPAHA